MNGKKTVKRVLLMTHQETWHSERCSLELVSQLVLTWTVSLCKHCRQHKFKHWLSEMSKVCVCVFFRVEIQSKVELWLSVQVNESYRCVSCCLDINTRASCLRLHATLKKNAPTLAPLCSRLFNLERVDC